MDLLDINLRMAESCPEGTIHRNSRLKITGTNFMPVYIISWASFSVSYRVTTNRFYNRPQQLPCIVSTSRISYTNPAKRTSSSTSVITPFAGLAFLNLQSIPYHAGMCCVHPASESMGSYSAGRWWRSINAPSSQIKQANLNRYISNQRLRVFEYWC